MKENIEISQLKDCYICQESTYNLIAKGATAEEAFEKFNTIKAEYLKQVEEYELINNINLYKLHEEKILSPKLRENIKKNTLTLFFIILWGFGFGASFKLAFSHTSKVIASKSSKFTDLSEKEKLSIFRDKLQVVKPYIMEIKKLLTENKQSGEDE